MSGSAVPMSDEDLGLMLVELACWWNALPCLEHPPCDACQPRLKVWWDTLSRLDQRTWDKVLDTLWWENIPLPPMATEATQ